MKYKNSILWSRNLLIYILQSALIIHFAVPNLRWQASVIALYVGLGLGGFIAVLHLVRLLRLEKRNIPSSDSKSKK